MRAEGLGTQNFGNLRYIRESGSKTRCSLGFRFWDLRLGTLSPKP